MNIVVTCEFRFYRTPDQKVWTSSAFPHAFWLRYLTVFNNVKVVARVKEVEQKSNRWQQVNGEKVDVVALPYYVGLAGLLKNIIEIRRIIHQTVALKNAVIYRVPSQTAMIATFGRLNKNNNYALEVVGDPNDVFQSGIVNRLVDKVLSWVSTFALQRMVDKAVAVSYVTQSYLQRNYPTKPTTFSIDCSSIELHATSLRAEPRVYTQKARHLLFIGSFGQMYKGPDVLINALAELNRTGEHYQLTMLGDGVYLDAMQTLATTLGCQKWINFVGEVAQHEVQNYLSSAEVFIMPSRTEGLPRALIEAMAAGLPCIGSNVGGIPELLNEQAIFSSENASMLASKIKQLSDSVQQLNQASECNLAVARGYELSILSQKRQQFYQYVKQMKLIA